MPASEETEKNDFHSTKTSTFGLVQPAEITFDRPLRIAQIAPLAESVPPKKYGGTERIVHFLTEELTRLGHKVTLFAADDSKTSAELVSDPAWPSLRLNPSGDIGLPHVWMMEQICRRAHEFDIIHCHTEVFFFVLNLFPERSCSTLHGILSTPTSVPFFKTFADVPLISISDDQRTHLACKGNFVGTVYHGLPRHLLTFKENASCHYLAFTGRICPDKRPDWAIEIAVKVGMPLKIAAKVDPVDKKYWEEQIRPLVERHADLVEFIGEIDDQQKGDFFGNALALLFPIDWAEPFGLVMIEAMACGTPVIARRRGSVPEVIDDGVTGFIVDDVDEAVEAISRVDQLDRAEIRHVFERKYTATKMTENYLRIYKQMLDKQKERERN